MKTAADSTVLVPPPEIVNERLQEVLEEATLLRRLLRLSVRARNAGKANMPRKGHNKKAARAPAKEIAAAKESNYEQSTSNSARSQEP